jgi:hypothetical protein
MTTESPAIREDSQSGNGKEIAERRPYEALVDRLQMNAQYDAEHFDSFEISSQIVDKITAAETLDDILDAQESGAESLKENEYLIGRPLTIAEPRYIESDEAFRENNLGVFVVFEAYEDGTKENPQGIKHIISTGAPQVVATIEVMDRKQYLPARIRFVNKGRKNRVIAVSRA